MTRALLLPSLFLLTACALGTTNIYSFRPDATHTREEEPAQLMRCQSAANDTFIAGRLHTDLHGLIPAANQTEYDLTVQQCMATKGYFGKTVR